MIINNTIYDEDDDNSSDKKEKGFKLDTAGS